jgi:hypothetical protein
LKEVRETVSPNQTVTEAASSHGLPGSKARPGLQTRLLFGAGTFLLLAMTVLFIAIWWRVILGHRVLLGGDILYLFPPWSAAVGAHLPANPLGSDVLTQFLPRLPITADAYRHGALALWDPYALAGKPLLADDVSATLSPFTIVALPFSAAFGLSISIGQDVGGRRGNVRVPSASEGSTSLSSSGVAYVVTPGGRH